MCMRSGTTRRLPSGSVRSCSSRLPLPVVSRPPGTSDVQPRRRPRLLVLNQYYWPGVEATAHLLAELCEALSDDFDVTVVTGRLRTEPHLPHDEVHGGVRIVRVASSTYDRASLGGRAANYVTYMLQAFRLA